MPHHLPSIIHTLCLSEYNSPSSFINHSYSMFIGLSFPIILHQSFIPYIIGIACPSSLINHSYPMFMGISFPVILHQSFIPYVYRNIISRHPSSIIHTLCLSEYHSPSSVINHSYPMFLGISFQSLFINHSYLMFIGISCPVILLKSFIPYVYRTIIPRHPSSIIHTLCLSEYHSPSSFINHSYPMFIGISCPVILHQSFIPCVYRISMPRHPLSILHNLCLSEYDNPSSFNNHSYPMFIGISCPIIRHKSFIPYVHRNVMPIIRHQSFIPYVYRKIMPRNRSPIIHTICLSEYQAPSSFINHLYTMLIWI